MAFKLEDFNLTNCNKPDFFLNLKTIFNTTDYFPLKWKTRYSMNAIRYEYYGTITISDMLPETKKIDDDGFFDGE